MLFMQRRIKDLVTLRDCAMNGELGNLMPEGDALARPDPSPLAPRPSPLAMRRYRQRALVHRPPLARARVAVEAVHLGV